MGLRHIFGKLAVRIASGFSAKSRRPERALLGAVMLTLIGADAMAADGPMGAAGDWVSVFSETFEEPVLSEARWTTCYWWDDDGCTNLGNNELQWYVPHNVTVEDGHLVLTARPGEVTGFRGRRFPYTSGMVTSGRMYEERALSDRFSFTYGFVEVRARPPIGQGLWAAIWMLPSDHTSRPEIDIMEVLGHRPDVLEMHYHYGDEDSAGSEAEIAGLSGQWQTYGVDWSPEAIVWYLNGVEQWRFDDAASISDVPMYLLLNLAVGGDWPGAPDATTKFPAHFLIDSVRVWQRDRQ